MTIVQWLLLILVIAVVVGAYLYLRSQSGTDPWQGMDDDGADEAMARGESLDGDSYIVAVRNLSTGDEQARESGDGDGHGDDSGPASHDRVSDADAERSWAAYKKAAPADDSARKTSAAPQPVISSGERAGVPAPQRPRRTPGRSTIEATYGPEPRAPTPQDAERESEPARPGAPAKPGPASAPAVPEPDPEAPADEARTEVEDESAQADRAPAAKPARGATPATAAKPKAEPAASTRSEPAVERIDNMRPQRVPPGEQNIFTLHVTSVDGGFFRGEDIHAALAKEELKFGLNDIYHRVSEQNGVPESVFAVADMLKPGLLDPSDKHRLATPGLTMFLVLPGPVEGVPAMRDMMVTANAIARALGGEVLDDKRARLKAQTAQYMLDQIAELDRQARISSRR